MTTNFFDAIYVYGFTKKRELISWVHMNILFRLDKNHFIKKYVFFIVFLINTRVMTNVITKFDTDGKY